MKLLYWAAGIALALFGVVTARVLSPIFEQPVIKLLSYLTGILFSLAGLSLIVMGMAKPWPSPSDPKGSPRQGPLCGQNSSMEPERKEGGTTGLIKRAFPLKGGVSGEGQAQERRRANLGNDRSDE